jgi:hypothetical protein
LNLVEQTFNCDDAILDKLSEINLDVRQIYSLAVIEALQVKSDTAEALFMVWSNDPTTGNCNAAKSAYQVIVNEGSVFAGCETSDSIQALINAAQSNINILNSQC